MNHELTGEVLAPQMDRRAMLKFTGMTIGAIAVGGPAVLSQIACGSTKQLAKWTGVAIDMLNQLSPILTDMGAVGVVALVARAIPIAEKLKKAFQDNDHASALILFDSLTNPQTGIIVELSNVLGVLQGPQRRILLGLLATAQVMLHLIAANIQDNVPPAAVATARAANPTAARSVERAAQSPALERAFAVSRF